MADQKPLSRLNKKELEKLAKKEGVELEDGATVSDIRDAIRAGRGEGETDADGGENLDDGGDGPQRKVEGQEERQGVGDTTVPQGTKTIPTSTEGERRDRSGGGDFGQPSAEGKETPDSELPGGPNIDLGAVSGDAGEEGAVSAPTGDVETSREVTPATRQADGAPQPPQPTGSDEGGGIPGIQSKPGSLAAVSTATNKANAERMQKEDGGKERAAALRRGRESAAAPEEDAPKPTIGLSDPRAENTMLTITGRNFPPRERVRVELSHSQTPSGVTLLRSDLDGVVQVSLYPAPGKQSATFRTDTAEATIEFEVAAAQNWDPDGDEEREAERTRRAEKRAARNK